jgi:signal transduction histidine kinase/CheY-like chemotaxis protein
MDRRGILAGLRGDGTLAAEFEVLLETGQRLAETLNLPDILQAAVDGISGLVGLDTAAVYLVEGEHLRLWATFPPLPPEFPDHLRVAPLSEHPHIGRACAGGDHVLVEDLRRGAETDAEREVAAQRDLRTVLYVPMVIDGDAIGAFIVGSTGEIVTISETRIALARALAHLSALTVRNARLFRKVETRSAELQQSLAERVLMEREREILRAQLSQAQKLESIGRLAGGVAHDFNNMLHVILGYTELAMGTVPEGAPAHGDLQEVRRAAERSARITRQLLAFARKQTIEPRGLDLNESVEGMLKMLHRLLGEDLDLAWAPAGKPVHVFLDPSQLDQILANLCVNAREAVQGVGRVTLETHSVVIDEAYCEKAPGFVPGEFSVLVVSDDGCGMDERVQEKLFDPFFTTKQDGTGLGLATVYGIVKQNDGFINVYSEPGQGSTFRIYLPRHHGVADATADRGDPVVLAAAGETVLVVEDDPSILKLAELMLESLGYAVLGAGTAEDALAVVRGQAGPIHLLVTDVVMPGMNGRELARQLGESRPDLKVLFMSGYTSNVIAHRGVLDDDVHFIPKPFTRALLAAKVREALDG